MHAPPGTPSLRARARRCTTPAPSPCLAHRKYKTYEANLLAQKKRYKTQIPDIQSSLAVVKDLQQRKDAGGEAFIAHFNLADQIYAKAEVAPEDKVALWLGANVMLEYTYAEASDLLTNNLTIASDKAREVNEDLDWVRDNIVVCEVNMARVFNFDVMTRRAAKKTGAA